jgi:hypothetical protein
MEDLNMERSEAIQIVQTLADGRDPRTGEPFPSDSPYQSAQVTRALFFAIRSLESRRGPGGRNRNLPENAGKPWSMADDEALARRFDDAVEVPDLAQEFKRTEEAIRARLVRLGKIDSVQEEEQPVGARASNGAMAR